MSVASVQPVRLGPVRLPSGVRTRLVLLAVAVVVVYAPGLVYTYSGLLATFDPTGPLLFVPFVPLGAAAVAATRWRGEAREPDAVAQRAADIAVALLLFALAFLCAVVSPSVFATETLTWRGDLISFAPFVAGMVTLLFGLRMLYRIRAALFLLTAMAPAIYRPIVSVVGDVVDAATTLGVRLLDLLLPFLVTTATPEGLYGRIESPGGIFTVAVTQACGGSGSVLAGILLTSVVLLVTNGPRKARVGWAATTLTACWLGNLLRLTVLFVAGHLGGPELMLGELHLWLGAATLALVSSVALLLTGRFGLEFRATAAHPEPTRCLPRLDIGAAVVAVLAVSLIAAPAVAATNRYNFLSGASSSERMSAGAFVPTLRGAVALQPISWAPTYFGPGARWDRWLVFDEAAVGGGAHPISVDVLRTTDPSRFDQYGLVACFGFHGYDVDSQGTVALPDGRTGELITYVDPADGDTARVLSWRQRTDGGHVERVVVQRRAPAGATSRPASDLLAAAEDLLRAGDGEVVDASGV